MKKLFLIVMALIFGALAGCARAPKTDESFAMNTIVHQTVYADNGDVILQNNQILYRLENELSKTMQTSDIYRINHAEGAVEVSEETARILSACLVESVKTKGAFDPALGAVTDAWGFGTDGAHVPPTQELSRLLAASGYSNLRVDASTVDAGGADVDLGGAAKGYALDALRENFVENGVSSALVSVGGSIYAHGSKPDGTAWKIGIRDPLDPAASYLCALELRNACISTSGVYERNFTENGITYHHILDPQTGYPADNGLVSVSVVDQSGLLTDIYSTALLVMGAEDGLAYANAHGVSAVFITEDKQILLTEGFDHQFTIKDSSYHAE